MTDTRWHRAASVLGYLLGHGEMPSRSIRDRCHLEYRDFFDAFLDGFEAGIFVLQAENQHKRADRGKPGDEIHFGEHPPKRKPDV